MALYIIITTEHSLTGTIYLQISCNIFTVPFHAENTTLITYVMFLSQTSILQPLAMLQLHLIYFHHTVDFPYKPEARKKAYGP